MRATRDKGHGKSRRVALTGRHRQTALECDACGMTRHRHQLGPANEKASPAREASNGNTTDPCSTRLLAFRACSPAFRSWVACYTHTCTPCLSCPSLHSKFRTHVMHHEKTALAGKCCCTYMYPQGLQHNYTRRACTAVNHERKIEKLTGLLIFVKESRRFLRKGTSTSLSRPGHAQQGGCALLLLGDYLVRGCGWVML
jgi:hypothetical protein